MEDTIVLTEVSDVVTPAEETNPKNYNFSIESTWEEIEYSAGGGGITPSGTKNISITQNGMTTEDVTEYASAEITVDVPNSYAAGDEGKVVSSGELVSQTSQSITANGSYDTTTKSSVTVNTIDDFFNMAVPTGVLYSEISGSPPARTSNRTGITELNLPNITTIPSYFSNNCPNLKKIVMPNLETVDGTNAFSNCGINMPVFIPKANLFTSIFAGCSQLQTVVFLKINTSNQKCFQNCTSLKTVDILGNPSFAAANFQSCTNLDTIILRRNGVVAMTTQQFGDTKFKASGTGGKLYVPSNQISNYESATNWSSLLSGNANNQILAIEGSIYETQYADGTPIPTE